MILIAGPYTLNACVQQLEYIMQCMCMHVFIKWLQLHVYAMLGPGEPNALNIIIFKSMEG